jgi:hypothetical protein
MMLPDPSTRGLGHATGRPEPTVCVGAWHGYRPAVPAGVPPAAWTGVLPAAPRREPFERTEKGTW